MTDLYITKIEEGFINNDFLYGRKTLRITFSNSTVLAVKKLENGDILHFRDFSELGTATYNQWPIEQELADKIREFRLKDTSYLL